MYMYNVHMYMYNVHMYIYICTIMSLFDVYVHIIVMYTYLSITSPFRWLTHPDQSAWQSYSLVSDRPHHTSTTSHLRNQSTANHQTITSQHARAA